MTGMVSETLIGLRRHSQNLFLMIKNYLLVTFRNLWRNKAFSFINIVGLAFGISCSLIIFLWVNDEMRMDAFHANKDRLYKILENQTYSGGQMYTFSSTPGPMAPVLKERFPEIEMATRITWPERRLFQFKEKNFYEEGRFVDQDFILMHSYPLSKGDINSCLMDNHSIVISQKMAKKFFGEEDPIGKFYGYRIAQGATLSFIAAIRFSYSF